LKQQLNHPIFEYINMTVKLPLDVSTIKGFMDPIEGEALYHLACEMAPSGPVVEIGSYCGKSTVYIGQACKENDSVLYAVDHHKGSEENQQGWEHHDGELFDGDTGMLNTLPLFRKAMRDANLENNVIPLVTTSEIAARFWTTPVAMVFIDGGHAFEMAFTDYKCWAPHVLPGGVLAFHDIFEHEKDGGQAPYEVMQMALASGFFTLEKQIMSLAVLRCTAYHTLPRS
jgi:predicted O-methyltransferase YrrM